MFQKGARAYAVFVNARESKIHENCGSRNTEVSAHYF